MYKLFSPLFILSLFIFFITPAFAQAQGKYAGSMKKLVATTYTDSRYINGLEGWEFRQGSLVSAIDDPVSITLDVHQKGTTWIVFFSIMDDTATKVYTIADVLEIKSVKKGWEIKTTFCRQNKLENIEIVALVKSAYVEFMTNIKQAWRFDRSKRRFEAISIKGIDCMNEGLSYLDVKMH